MGGDPILGVLSDTSPLSDLRECGKQTMLDLTDVAFDIVFFLHINHLLVAFAP